MSEPETPAEGQSAPPAPVGETSSSPWPFAVIITVLAIVVAALVVWQGRERSGPVDSPPIRGVRLEPLLGDGPAVDDRTLQGKVVLMNFWGTWCRPCLEEFPHIHALYQEFKNRQDFLLLAVSCLPPGEPFDRKLLAEETQAFLDQYNAQMPVYVDPQQLTRRALAQRGAWSGAYPTTVLLDRQGRIRYHWVGYRPGTEVEMRQQVLQALARQ